MALYITWTLKVFSQKRMAEKDKWLSVECVIINWNIFVICTYKTGDHLFLSTLKCLKKKSFCMMDPILKVLWKCLFQFQRCSLLCKLKGLFFSSKYSGFFLQVLWLITDLLFRTSNSFSKPPSVEFLFICYGQPHVNLFGEFIYMIKNFFFFYVWVLIWTILLYFFYK